MQERFERLTALQDRIAAEENALQLGRRVEVMVTAQSGRKAGETHRLSGRSQDQRLVHFSGPAGAATPGEHLDLVGDAGTGRVDEPEDGQLLAQRHLGGAHDLLDRCLGAQVARRQRRRVVVGHAQGAHLQQAPHLEAARAFDLRHQVHVRSVGVSPKQNAPRAVSAARSASILVS